MKNSRFAIILLAAVSIILLSGCAKMMNRVANEGGWIGSYPGDYIVRNDSGGRIMDVWLLHNVMVSPQTQEEGYLFRDEKGNCITIGGDVKIIRILSKDSDLWNQYREYHAEFSAKTYQETFPDLMATK